MSGQRFEKFYTVYKTKNDEVMDRWPVQGHIVGIQDNNIIVCAHPGGNILAIFSSQLYYMMIENIEQEEQTL